MPEILCYVVAMDSLDFLAVRFHFSGDFFNDGKKMQYLGGTKRVSFIDRDKISLPEVMGHLNDHFNPTDTVLLHWLIPRKDLRTELRTLVDDKVCHEMSSCITHPGAPDVFVEVICGGSFGKDIHLAMPTIVLVYMQRLFLYI